MMQKTFFSGAALLVLASLLVSTSAQEQQRRNLFQRRLDIDDLSPLSARDNKRILKMMDRGILHSPELSARAKPMQQRALKGSSSKSKSKKSEMSTNSRSQTRPPKLVYYGGFNDTSTGTGGSSIKGKGGKGGKATKKSRKCEVYTGKGKGSSSSSSRSTKAPTSSRKSGKGWCTEGEAELLPLQIYFAHEHTDSVVVTEEDASEYYMGTTYTYNERAFLGEVTDPALNNLTALIAEGRKNYTDYVVDGDDVIGRAAGRCTRIDPNLDSNGDRVDQSKDFTFSTYCQFTYEFFEDDDGATATYLTAEGVIQHFGNNCTSDCQDLSSNINLDKCGQLAATGGTGFFRRIIGEVFVCPTAYSNNYMEVFASLWLDSRVVSYSVYDDIIEGSSSSKGSRSSSGKATGYSGKATSRSEQSYT